MDIIKDSLTTIVDRFRYEVSTEHFVSQYEPTVDDYKQVAPYFKSYNIAPQDAFKVLMFFDKDPSNLTKEDLNSRIKMLNILYEMLNDPEMSSKILRKYEVMSGKNADSYQIENTKGIVNLLKRLVKLLILEANGDDERNQISMFSCLLFLIIIILVVMLYKKN